MYGAYWCPHCNTVKEEFGNALRFINYVECDARGPNPNPDKCKLDGIQYYPTFKFGDGTTLFGEVSFEIMAQKTGCSLPE
jgi:thiol-disulfide isomerase/thioredoxin